MKAPATRLAWLLVALMAAAALAVPMPEEEETSTLSPKPAAGRKKSKNKNPFSLEDNVSGLHPLTVMDVHFSSSPSLASSPAFYVCCYSRGLVTMVTTGVLRLGIRGGERGDGAMVDR